MMREALFPYVAQPDKSRGKQQLLNHCRMARISGLST